MPDVVHITFDGTAVEGVVASSPLELTMTDFTPPDRTIFAAVAKEVARSRKHERTDLVAVELGPEDLRLVLGSLHEVHVELVSIGLGLAPMWEGYELRTNPQLGRGRFMPVWRCATCGGSGRAFVAALGREEPCTRCRETGERRGF